MLVHLYLDILVVLNKYCLEQVTTLHSFLKLITNEILLRGKQLQINLYEALALSEIWVGFCTLYSIIYDMPLILEYSSLNLDCPVFIVKFY